MFDRPKMQARGKRVEESEQDKEHVGGTVEERLSEARTERIGLTGVTSSLKTV